MHMESTTQKIITIGSSLGVTMPKKDLKRLGLNAGDMLDIQYKPSNKPTDHDIEVVAIAQKLINRHKIALKSLSQR